MIALEPFYIHVNSPKESEIVQKLLFKCGFRWAGDSDPKVRLTDMAILVLTIYNEILYCRSSDRKISGRRTITLEQLINEIESTL